MVLTSVSEMPQWVRIEADFVEQYLLLTIAHLDVLLTQAEVAEVLIDDHGI